MGTCKTSGLSVSRLRCHKHNLHVPKISGHEGKTGLYHLVLQKQYQSFPIEIITKDTKIANCTKKLDMPQDGLGGHSLHLLKIDSSR